MLVFIGNVNENIGLLYFLLICFKCFKRSQATDALICPVKMAGKNWMRKAQVPKELRALQEALVLGR